jgi:hypothetical protein
MCLSAGLGLKLICWRGLNLNFSAGAQLIGWCCQQWPAIVPTMASNCSQQWPALAHSMASNAPEIAPAMASNCSSNGQQWPAMASYF